MGVLKKIVFHLRKRSKKYCPCLCLELFLNFISHVTGELSVLILLSNVKYFEDHKKSCNNFFLFWKALQFPEGYFFVPS